MAKITSGIDPTDLRLLEVLRDDGRISIAALAAAIGVSRANAYTRLERLREDGVIKGFTVRIDHEKIGLDVTAISFLKVRQPARQVLSEPLRRIPGIEYAAFVTGEQDVIVKMRAPDVRTLRDETMSRLSEEQPVQGLNTILVLDEIVDRPFVLPG